MPLLGQHAKQLGATFLNGFHIALGKICMLGIFDYFWKNVKNPSQFLHSAIVLQALAKRLFVVSMV